MVPQYNRIYLSDLRGYPPSRIRCFAWEIAEEYLTDCLNVFRAPSESFSGNSSSGSTFLYRSHPSKPNDTLMAINYGYMLGKALIGEPITASPGESSEGIRFIGRLGQRSDDGDRQHEDGAFDSQCVVFHKDSSNSYGISVR